MSDELLSRLYTETSMQGAFMFIVGFLWTVILVAILRRLTNIDRNTKPPSEKMK